jgi:hypothetical protein
MIGNKRREANSGRRQKPVKGPEIESEYGLEMVFVYHPE